METFAPLSVGRGVSFRREVPCRVPTSPVPFVFFFFLLFLNPCFSCFLPLAFMPVRLLPVCSPYSHTHVPTSSFSSWPIGQPASSLFSYSSVQTFPASASASSFSFSPRIRTVAQPATPPPPSFIFSPLPQNVMAVASSITKPSSAFLAGSK